MVGRLVVAVVVAVAVGLGLTFLGVILETLSVPVAASSGAFVEKYSWTIGVLAGLWHFFAGSGLDSRFRRS